MTSLKPHQSSPLPFLPSPSAATDASNDSSPRGDPVARTSGESTPTETKSNHESLPHMPHDNNIVSPLKFLTIDPNQRLPRLAFSSKDDDSDAELITRAKELVHWAISSKHENSATVNVTTNTDTSTNPAVEAARQHGVLLNLLRKKSDTSLLHATLHAIISSNSGRELDRLVTNSKLHAHMIHLIMQLDPFVPPASSSLLREGGTEKNVGIDKLSKLDKARIERKKKTMITNNAALALSPSSQLQAPQSILKNTPKKNKNQQQQSSAAGVQIAESSIRHKENAEFLSSTLPYFNYQMADIYLHLLVTLVSNNSLLSMSAIRSIWGLLTTFGLKWVSWMSTKSVEERREQNQIQMKKVMDERRRQTEEGIDEGKLPASKKRKLEIITPVKKLHLSTAFDSDSGKIMKDEWPVPGLSGLSVEFVRDALLYGRDDNGGGATNDKNVSARDAAKSNDSVEVICWDRMASGRVQRLLLALMNVFRLCPRSKSDLQREMASNFPHYKTCSPALYTWYAHMCLQMVHLVPTFEGPILCLFVDKALDMDVDIKINSKGLVMLDTTSKDNGDEGEINHNEQNIGVGDANHSAFTSRKRTFEQISTTTNNKLSNRRKSLSDLPAATAADDYDDESNRILEISDRLDTLMVVLYGRIIDVTSFSPDSLSSAMAAVLHARRLYRHLDSVFDKKVRTTDRSKFVQFAFFVLFGRENDALEAVGKLMAKREHEQQQQDVVQTMKEMEKNHPDIVIPNTAPINVTDPLYRGFSAKLIDFFYNPSHAGDVPRQTVVCYLASFVSRAAYVCPETVSETVAALLRWAEVYISAQPAGAIVGGMDNGGVTPAKTGRRSLSSSRTSHGITQHPCDIHPLFYTACQAAFYIMCFRGAEALEYYRKACEHKDDPESRYAEPVSVDIGPERWKFLCGHALQPLKYCLESVRLEFLHLAEDLELFIEHPTTDDDEESKMEESNKLLEHLWNTSFPIKQGDKHTPRGKGKKKASTPKRRRSIIISTAATQEKKRMDGGVGGLGRGSNPLNSFFPFDPYLLQKSYKNVHPYYRNWEDCITTIEDETEMNDKERAAVANSDVSDLEDEEDAEDGEDDESDNNGEEEDEDEPSRSSKLIKPKVKKTSSANGLASLQEDNHFEMEIRRSRAMSTGSQCSW